MVDKDRKLYRKWLAPAAIVLGLSMPLAANAGHDVGAWDIVVGATLANAFHDSYDDRRYPARYYSGYRFTQRDWHRQHRHWRVRDRRSHRGSHRSHRLSHRNDRHDDRHDRDRNRGERRH